MTEAIVISIERCAYAGDAQYYLRHGRWPDRPGVVTS